MTYHEQVWRVLVEKCGVSAHDGCRRADFLHYAMTDHPREFSFGGSLGFGGKVYFDGRMRVSCYPEDVTAERLSAMASANVELHGLWVEHLMASAEARP